MKISLPIAGSRLAFPASVPPRPDGFVGAPRLVDARGRAITYLRLSLTDRCNLACVYCMPPGGEIEHALRPELLSFEEAARLIRVFARGGIRRVRFTGGEPLVRKDVVRLVAMARREVDELQMTTNAVRLPELARPLKEAGLTGVNVSLDTLDPDRFRAVTRGGEVGPVIAGVHAALDAGLEVKINAVALGGDVLPESDAADLVDWAWSLGVTPRFIELMPLGEAAKLPADAFLSAERLKAILGDRVVPDDRGPDAGHGPARYLTSPDGRRRVGFITAISDTFCAACNRVRVTAQGDVRACLADRRAVSLRDQMRAGASDLDLGWAIHWALATKDASHHFLDPAVTEHEEVGMSLIGG